MKKLTIIVKPGRAKDVIEIFESCAVYGIMEEDIHGYGTQKGYTTNYRGLKNGVNTLIKTKLQTVGDDDTIQFLAMLLEEKLKTGKIGDGKIFIEDVFDAVRIRTGERGEQAL
ncbi:MAG: P-II family nitrogen regulator [Butyrivibrio sp.]|nr:P-II family nitrogen regulator [Muribaculum sp.]MCM1551250.1 P-II family nitrogen regulator [Butyrivibrio sp.]